MRCTVIWIPDADDELARIRTEAADKREVAAATNEVERLLKRQSLSVGEA